MCLTKPYSLSLSTGQNNCTGTIVPVNCFWNCSDSGAPENVSEEAECFNNSGPKMFYPTKRNFQLLRSPTFIR